MLPKRSKFAKGYLFDVYHTEDKIYLWIKTYTGESLLFFDSYQPIIYARGDEGVLKKLVRRLYELDALGDHPQYEERNLFYENRTVPVLKLVVSRPSILARITKKLYALYGKFDIYHSDIDVPTSYMFHKGLFPLCEVKLSYTVTDNNGRQIKKIKSRSSVPDMDYKIPTFKSIHMKLEKSYRIGFQNNPLILQTDEHSYRLSVGSPKELLQKIDSILQKEDPDIIFSSYGDHVIFPKLFSYAQKVGFLPCFDRDKTAPIRRHITTKGTSYFTYGNIVFRAPSYPLFGRWHIDSANSFVYKEAYLAGIVELARLSRLPIQRMARASTGKALTYIETDVALRRGYLVPWQKSAVESPKTALQLLEADKGGLVFQPDISCGKTAENVAQLDFAQMYPSIMVLHNISPECVNCSCCESDPSAPIAPGIGYHICNKRIGIVSEALKHVLDRRAYYKRKVIENDDRREEYDAKQSSLKWMLVTSFGYLGYRNAKFGRLESHESVNAFAREKLLAAKEATEERGYVFIHAITDSIFIRKEDSSAFTSEELQNLCSEIFQRTDVKIEVDGIYTWLAFPPSSQDPLMPVANRYMGRFESGKLKFRGIGARRKDLPIFIRAAQTEMLEWMRTKISAQDLKHSENEILSIYSKYDSLLRHEKVSWKELLVKRSTTKDLEEYEVDSATSLSLHKLRELGMEVQAGEKVKYLVLNQASKSKGLRYTPEEELQLSDKQIHYDKKFYRKLLLNAFREVWSEFASFNDFDSLIDDQGRLPF
ncbi:DNA polymerase family B [Leptospira fainei serovar Hurstbridge str. BUT 6]|uniref:DNA-directed DNA polymerase n=1 Tax=Leptospira fainei serovar Hurstbridge str. BUT 6 TaxID=1193011 RepID=S3V739_9LEPT|nr:DNA polymerase domain-containing protein [Leptospira fainei]EPG76469.1 DNA polymerase family B [Leptospira fainei serovar Hurstbridge str. BUT 6]